MRSQNSPGAVARCYVAAMTQADVTVFHNPMCSTSRRVVEMIRERGVEPRIVEYLEAGWTVADLEALLAEMGARPRDILRVREGLAEEMGLTDAEATDAAILGAMAADPVLVERPIVRGPKGTVLARPGERALEVL